MKDRKQNKPPYNTRQDTSCRDDTEGKKINKKQTNSKNQKSKTQKESDHKKFIQCDSI